MKLKNQGSDPIVIRFAKLDYKVKPEERDTSDLPTISIGPNQIGEVPDMQWEFLKNQRRFKLLRARKLLIECPGGVLPGDGDPDCELCHGRGFITIDTLSGRRCLCGVKRDIIANVRAIWPGYDLLRSPKLEEESSLKALVGHSVYITATKENFQRHLRYVSLRQGPHWFCRVRSDVDMMSAWFANAKAKSVEIFDTDVREAHAKDLEILDLAETPDLLVMYLGVKRSRNSATPEALMEILMIREMLGKPTWVVDQPDYQIGAEGHLCNSPEVLTQLSGYKRLNLGRARPLASQEEDLDDVLDLEVDEEGEPVKKKTPAKKKKVRTRRRKATGQTGPTSLSNLVED